MLTQIKRKLLGAIRILTGVPPKRQGRLYREIAFPAMLLIAMLVATVGWIWFLGSALWRSVLWLFS